jgi:hypothetical protein
MNLDIFPYYDDFESDKEYKQILALPGAPVQARDITQSQSMLIFQIQELGNTLYRDGQILRGCQASINDSKTQITISSGDVYVEGFVVHFVSSTVLAIKGVGKETIGLIKNEEIITETMDGSLRDPAQNYDKKSVASSHRLKKTWSWKVLNLSTDQGSATLVYQSELDKTGIGVFNLLEGAVTAEVKTESSTQPILDMVAKRDYMKDGNFVLEGLKIKVLDHPTDNVNFRQLAVTAGIARIQGYDIEISTNWIGDIPIARDKATIIAEPWGEFEAFDPLTYAGAQYKLGERPVADVSRVVATFLAVDGFGSRSALTRGAITGGSDELSEQSVVRIIAINQGGTWNPTTEQFVGGYTFPSNCYVKDGNNISWAPVGTGNPKEPSPGSTYQVAYQFRKQLTKQIVVIQPVSNERLVHGTDDTLAHDYLCEINTDTGVTINVCNPTGTGDPPDIVTSDYVEGTDFTLDQIGNLIWFEYDVNVITVTKGAPDQPDDFSSLVPSGWLFYEIIGVAVGSGGGFYFDYTTGNFVGATTLYDEGDDFTYVKGTPTIDWGPSAPISREPGASTQYKIAVRLRKYLSSNHPTLGNSYFVSYSYWKTVTSGDYLSRDSFYRVYDGSTGLTNTPQHYGLDFQDYVNFWRSDNFKAGIGNMERPYPGTMVEIDYEYYLPRYCVIEYHNTELVRLHYGVSSTTPTEPVFDEGNSSIILGKLFMPADSGSMVVTEFGVRALKVVDLQNMRDRIIRTEQNLANTYLDLDSKSIPVANKKGISTSAFRDNARFDVGWVGTSYSIDPDWEELTLGHIDSLANGVVDETATTGKVYSTIVTLEPSGTDVIEQIYYTEDESIAPYATALQGLETAQAAYMELTPPGDSVVIPRTVSFETESDADAWTQSDVAKLSDPAPWFAGGWRGGQQQEVAISEQAADETGRRAVTTTKTQDVNDTQTQTWTSAYLRDVQGVCRQIEVTFRIPGGLPPRSKAELDFFLYFGGIKVDVTTLGGTPPGNTAGSFGVRDSDRGAEGKFMIPPGIPEGSVEVKAVSNPIAVLGTEFRYTVAAIYNSSVTEKVTMQFDKCRCNCFSCNRCGNCFTCRGRCGTGPLAQTLEPFGKSRFLRDISLDYSMVHPEYGTYCSVLKTDNGVPTSATILNGTIGRKFLTATQMAGGGMKKYIFDDPIYIQSDTYAIMSSGEDGFNMNSVEEVAAGRDIRCKVAKLGGMDKTTGVTVGAQPFKDGMMFRSLTGITWEQDQKTDMKFQATFNVYPTQQFQIVQLTTLPVLSATAFLCQWNSQVPEGTQVIFEFKTRKSDWKEFAPYVLTKIGEEADELTFRARLSTTSPDVTPFVEKACGLYIQSHQEQMMVVTKAFDMAEGESANSLDIWIESHLPSGCSQDLQVTFDNGTHWVVLDSAVDGNPFGNLKDLQIVDLNAINVKVKYHWRIESSDLAALSPPLAHFTSYRVKISCVSTGRDAKTKEPRFSNFVTIAATA